MQVSTSFPERWLHIKPWVDKVLKKWFKSTKVDRAVFCKLHRKRVELVLDQTALQAVLARAEDKKWHMVHEELLKLCQPPKGVGDLLWGDLITNVVSSKIQRAVLEKLNTWLEGKIVVLEPQFAVIRQQIAKELANEPGMHRAQTAKTISTSYRGLLLEDIEVHGAV